MSKTPKISIVIPTYNHLEDCLKPCLESIIKYTDLEDVEIVIVAQVTTEKEQYANYSSNLIGKDLAYGSEYITYNGPFKIIWLKYKIILLK